MNTSRALVIALMLAMASFAVRAEPPWRSFLYPETLIYPNSLYATAGASCGGRKPDYATVGQSIDYDGRTRFDVDVYYGFELEDCVDTGSPGSGRVYAVDLGPLGEHVRQVAVVRRNWLLSRDASPDIMIYEIIDYRSQQFTADPNDAGVWWSPEYPGEITHLTIAGDSAVAFLATQMFDADGRIVPLNAWRVMPNRTFEMRATVPSRDGGEGGGVTATRTGILRFAVTGCGRAHLTYTAITNVLPSAERDLVQAAFAEGTTPCAFDPSKILRSYLLPERLSTQSSHFWNR